MLEVGERDGEARIGPLRRTFGQIGGFECNAAQLGQRFDDDPAVHRAIEHCGAGSGAGRTARSGLGDLARNHEPKLEVKAMILDPRHVNRSPAGLLVGGERLAHRHERLDQAAHPNLSEILHRIAEVGQLPVHHRGDLVAFVEEVARPGVAMHHHRQTAIIGNVGGEPIERERKQRIGAAGQVVLRKLAKPGRDRRRDRLMRIAERGQRRMARVDRVELGKLVEEIGGQCGLVGRLGKAVAPRHERTAQREMRRLGRDQPCDPDAALAKRTG